MLHCVTRAITDACDLETIDRAIFVECRKTKTKVITKGTDNPVNQSKRETSSESRVVLFSHLIG